MSQETCHFYSDLLSSGVGKVKRGYVFMLIVFLFVYISHVLHKPMLFRSMGFLFLSKNESKKERKKNNDFYNNYLKCDKNKRSTAGYRSIPWS
jgi:hypothetical protein